MLRSPSARWFVPAVAVLLLSLALAHYSLQRDAARGPGGGILRQESADPVRETLPAELVPVAESASLQDESPSEVPADCAFGTQAEPSFEGQDAFDRWRRQVTDALSPSADVEHLLLASLISPARDRDNVLSRIRRAIDLRPGAQFFYWHLLGECVASRDCDHAAIEGEITEQAGLDGAVWLRIAYSRFVLGDQGDTAEALAHAVGAPSFTDYFSRDFFLVERGLSAATDLGRMQRVVRSMDVVGMFRPSGKDLFDICFGTLSERSDIQPLCLQAAERLEASSLSDANTSLALSVQKMMHEALGNDTGYDMANGRLADFNAELQDSVSPRQAAILAYDERVMSRYLERLETYGQRDAARYARLETRRLLDSPAYGPCDHAPTRAEPATQDP